MELGQPQCQHGCVSKNMASCKICGFKQKKLVDLFFIHFGVGFPTHVQIQWCLFLVTWSILNCVTVAGRNPAPIDAKNISSFTGIQPSQVVHRICFM